MRRKRRRSKVTIMPVLDTFFKSTSLTTNESELCAKLQSSTSYGSNIGVTQLSQLRFQKITANKGRRHVTSIVQTHSSVQLSLGAASINGIINGDLFFTLRLTPDLDGTPKEPTNTSLRDVF